MKRTPQNLWECVRWLLFGDPKPSPETTADGLEEEVKPTSLFLSQVCMLQWPWRIRVKVDGKIVCGQMTEELTKLARYLLNASGIRPNPTSGCPCDMSDTCPRFQGLHEEGKM